jgi:hypothetical protein
MDPESEKTGPEPKKAAPDSAPNTDKPSSAR